MGWKTELHNAKLGHRPRLKGNWERDGCFESFPDLVERLEKEETYYIDEETADKWKNKSIPSVLDAATLTREVFRKEYEEQCIPSIIKNIPAGYDGGEFVGAWAAQDKWQIKALENDDVLLERKFKCGEDDYGKNIKVKLRHFLDYGKENQDDSPLYVFDSSFDDDKGKKRLMDDYRVPSYFSDDLFRLISESRRPPYRWWLMGPKRSGTCVHIDPLATSAWNTLVVGKKRWVIFPPHLSKSIVKGNGLVRNDEDDEAVHYFSFILPRIKRKASLMRGIPKYKNFCCFEFTQNAGETIYIPQGWWHAVLNITDTVAVTQNFCSPRTFDKSWLKTRSGRKRMAWKLLNALDEHGYPELAARARELNERDNFVMKYDPVEIEKRERTERQRKKDSKRRKDKKKEDASKRTRVDSPTSTADNG
ncbi:MAG: histone arginine demethylase JMJD6 [Bacillariaceae sp.]|jgi:histone arginine demethylase JMJD6